MNTATLLRFEWPTVLTVAALVATTVPVYQRAGSRGLFKLIGVLALLQIGLYIGWQGLGSSELRLGNFGALLVISAHTLALPGLIIAVVTARATPAYRPWAAGITAVILAALVLYSLIFVSIAAHCGLGGDCI